MTTDTILTALIDWAASRNITIVATKRDLPPADLDRRPLLAPTETASTGAGLHVWIDAIVHGGPEAIIAFWIPDSLKNGSWTASAVGDDEIHLCAIPEFADEKDLLAFVDRETDRFFLQHLQEAVLDEWLSEHGYRYAVVKDPDFCGEAAFNAEALGLQDWLIVEFSDAMGFGVTIGVSGKGDAATFLSNDDGFLTFDQRGSKLMTREAIAAWLDSTVATRA
jgi:hypothetical protein